jgi:transcriptional regulator with XRE-family HTH domain
VEPKEQFGVNLRRHREDAGLTQMELANRSGMDMAEISRLELGKRDPRLSTVARVARALELTASELVRDVEAGG